MKLSYARYRRRFSHRGFDCEVAIGTALDGVHSELKVAGLAVDQDFTPASGREAARNHRLSAMLPDGSRIEVEAGYINWVNVAIAVREDGRLVHESHPGRRIAMPEAAAKMAADPGLDMSRYKANRVPLMVDISLGLLFFVVAKLTDLPTAAIVGAIAGVGLLVAQRFVKTDLIGGLALFGVVMLLVSAALAIAFQDDMAVKMRSTIVGLISAALFLGDGLLGGKRLGKGLARYVPYKDIVPRRLAIGIGLVGLVMAGLNYAVARIASTDVWLFYSTFVDFCLVALLLIWVFRFARSGGGANKAG